MKGGGGFLSPLWPTGVTSYRPGPLSTASARARVSRPARARTRGSSRKNDFSTLAPQASTRVCSARNGQACKPRPHTMRAPRKNCESLPRVLDFDRSPGINPEFLIVGNTEPALSTRPQPIRLFDEATGVVTAGAADDSRSRRRAAVGVGMLARGAQRTARRHTARRARLRRDPHLSACWRR